jgi:hypothetical protein
MSLLFGPAENLAGAVAILDDRGSTVCRELMAERPFDDELDDVANQVRRDHRSRAGDRGVLFQGRPLGEK